MEFCWQAPSIGKPGLKVQGADLLSQHALAYRLPVAAHGLPRKRVSGRPPGRGASETTKGVGRRLEQS